MFCTKCGNEVPNDAAFCNKCGNDLTDAKKIVSQADTDVSVQSEEEEMPVPNENAAPDEGFEPAPQPEPAPAALEETEPILEAATPVQQPESVLVAAESVATIQQPEPAPAAIEEDGSPAEPERKSKTGLIIGIVAAVIVIAAVIAAMMVFGKGENAVNAGGSNETYSYGTSDTLIVSERTKVSLRNKKGDLIKKPLVSAISKDTGDVKTVSVSESNSFEIGDLGVAPGKYSIVISDTESGTTWPMPDLTIVSEDETSDSSSSSDSQNASEDVKYEIIVKEPTDDDFEETKDFKESIEKLEEYMRNAAYLEKVKELEDKYGKPSVSSASSTINYGDIYAIEGLAYAKLVDFDCDGKDELVVSYNPTDSVDNTADGKNPYKVEVWGYDVDSDSDEKMKLLYSGEASSGQMEFSIHLVFVTYEKKTCIMDTSLGEAEPLAIYGMKDGEFTNLVTYNSDMDGNFWINDEPPSYDAMNEMFVILDTEEIVCLASFSKTDLKKTVAATEKTLKQLEDAVNPEGSNKYSALSADTAYGAILAQLESEYGKYKLAPGTAPGMPSSSEQVYHMEGVFFYQLEDYDLDGEDEFAVAYYTPTEYTGPDSLKDYGNKNYVLKVFDYKDGEVSEILATTADQGGQAASFVIGDYKGTPVFAFGDYDGVKVYSLEDGKVTPVMVVDGIMRGKTTINGAPVSSSEADSVSEQLKRDLKDYYYFVTWCTPKDDTKYKTNNNEYDALLR